MTEIRRAVKSGRPTGDGLVAAEGPHLLEESLRGVWMLQEVLCTAAARVRFAPLLTRLPVLPIELPERTWQALAGTEHSQGILALLTPRRWQFDDFLLQNAPLAVILDTVQDPGNTGAIARSAEAFGARGLLLTEGCARVANGKTLRSAAGSFFRIPFLEGLTRQAIGERVQAAGLALYTLAGRGGMPLDEADLRQPCALIVGNEGAGVSGEWKGRATPLTISTTGVESLNAAIACSIALFEAARQRKVS